jgi:hypothetical protein
MHGNGQGLVFLNITFLYSNLAREQCIFRSEATFILLTTARRFLPHAKRPSYHYCLYKTLGDKS